MKTICALVVVCLFVQVEGCSVYRAANQPSKKDLSVLKPGTPRDRVIAELGAPVTSEPVEGGKKEIYTFVQGYSGGAKAGRAFGHAVADVFTIGLWEAVGTPIEGQFNGKKISVSVVYDSADLVTKSDTIAVTDP